jgi:hypothetical protein
MKEEAILGIFIAFIGYLMYGIGDSDPKIVTEVKTIAVVNFIMVCIFAYLSYTYIQASPNTANGFILFLALGTIFISIMAVSTSTLKALGNPVNGYWLGVFFPFLLIILALFFYLLFVLPEIQFISTDSIYKAVQKLKK